MRELHFMLLAICAVAPELAAQPDTSRRGVIRGIVLDTLGRPYSQIDVQLQRKTFDGLIPRRDTAWYLVTMRRYTTADDGRFEFTALERQVYTLAFYQSFLVSGRVDSVSFSDGPPMPPWLESFSVSSLFDEVEKAIRSREVIVEVVEYDPTFGVPTRLDTDTAYGGFDGYYRWRISDFQPSR